MRVLIKLAFRLARRFVETPLAFVLGIMIMMLFLTVLTWKNHMSEALQVIVLFQKYAVAIPLGLPPEQTDINLGTDQVIRLYAIWYTVYAVTAEVIEALLKLFAGGRTVPDRRILLSILVVGYGFAAMVLGRAVENGAGFAWWPAGVGLVLVGVGGVSMLLSWGLYRLEQSLLKVLISA